MGPPGQPARASSTHPLPTPCPQESPYQVMEGPSTPRGTPSSTVTPAIAPTRCGAPRPPTLQARRIGRRLHRPQISRQGAIAPPAHYPVAYLGVLPLPSDGSEDALPPPLRVAERMWDLIPFLDSPVVAFGEAMPHSDGRESTPPYLRMAGHFWWSRLPHTEIPSRLLHVLSEARGCRRAGVDVEHPLWRTTPIGTGVAVFLRNRPGPSIPSPSHFLRHSYGGRSQMRQGVNPSPEGQGPRSSGRTLPSPSLPLVHFPSRDDRPVAQGVGAPSGASTPLTPPTKGSAY